MILKFWKNNRSDILWTIFWTVIATVAYLTYLFWYGIPSTQSRLNEIGVDTVKGLFDQKIDDGQVQDSTE